MNALVKAAQGGALANKDKWAAIAGQYGSANHGGVQFLKFNGNDGGFTFGKDNNELPLGTRLAVNMLDYKVGFICWKEGEVVDEVMAAIISEDAPAKASLTDHGPYKTYSDGTTDGWSEQRSVTMRGLDDGETYEFKTTSKGALIAMGNLLRDYAKGAAMNDGMIAIVELAESSFVLKKVKGQPTKYAPIFKIVEWAEEADLLAKLDGAAAAAKAATEEAEAQEEATPPPATEVKRGRRF